MDMRIEMAGGLAALCSFLTSGSLSAQPVAGIKFEVLTKDNVAYNVDSTPIANYATAPAPTAVSARGRNFVPYLTIADVVAINGKPAKGVHVTRGTDLRLSSNRTNPANGRAISD